MQTGLELFYSTLKSIIEVHNNQQLDYWLQTTVGEPQKNRLSTFWYWWTHQQYRNKIEKDLFNHDCIDRKERTQVVWSTKFVFWKICWLRHCDWTKFVLLGNLSDWSDSSHARNYSYVVLMWNVYYVYYIGCYIRV